jgi:hypothetical protein
VSRYALGKITLSLDQRALALFLSFLIAPDMFFPLPVAAFAGVNPGLGIGDALGETSFALRQLRRLASASATTFSAALRSAASAAVADFNSLTRLVAPAGSAATSMRAIARDKASTSTCSSLISISLLTRQLPDLDRPRRR